MKVSVILTTYNSEGSLQATLDSVSNQTGQGTDFDIELIVVDDCSTDSTTSILHQNAIEYRSTSYNTGGPNRALTQLRTRA